MAKLLVVFEFDERGRVPESVAAVAGAAESAGVDVRVRALEVAGLRDVAWADVMAFGIDARGTALPPEAKRWLDALGFGGWRHLQDKAGCVFATRARSGDSAAACRMVARILRTRGMEAVTPLELAVAASPANDDGTAVGAALGRLCSRIDRGRPGVRRRAV